MCTLHCSRKYQLQNINEQSGKVRWFTARSLLKDCRAMVGFYSFLSEVPYKKKYAPLKNPKNKILTLKI